MEPPAMIRYEYDELNNMKVEDADADDAFVDQNLDGFTQWIEASEDDYEHFLSAGHEGLGEFDKNLEELLLKREDFDQAFDEEDAAFDASRADDEPPSSKKKRKRGSGSSVELPPADTSEGFDTNEYSTRRTPSPVVIDGFTKPAYSYSCLIGLALKNSVTGELTVAEIYSFLCEHFPFFRVAPGGWKNSVRHNLSLNKAFEKIEIEAEGCTGRKSCLWKMNPQKVAKMDQEIRKWRERCESIILKSMECPEDLDCIEQGRKGMPTQPRHVGPFAPFGSSGHGGSSQLVIKPAHPKIMRKSPYATLNMNKKMRPNTSTQAGSSGESIREAAARKLENLLQQKAAPFPNLIDYYDRSNEHLPSTSGSARIQVSRRSGPSTSASPKSKDAVPKGAGLSIGSNFTLIKKDICSGSPARYPRSSALLASPAQEAARPRHVQSPRRPMMSTENMTTSSAYGYVCDASAASSGYPHVTYVAVPYSTVNDRLIMAPPVAMEERSMSPFRYGSCYDAVTNALTNNSLLEAARSPIKPMRR